VVEGTGDVVFLDNSGAAEATGWVRCCTVLPGDAGSCPGANFMETDSLGSALPDGGQLEARLVHFDPP
jgi:hypothetical protein